MPRMFSSRTLLVVGLLALGTVLALPMHPRACTNEVLKVLGTEFYHEAAYGDRPTREQLRLMGQRLFLDPGLSASGKMSCASCHSPAHAYGSPNALMTQPGGAQMNRVGFRNTPSLRYVHSPIDFTEHFYELEVTGGQDDEGPTGGRTWDGRVNSGHDQALMPLMDINEMANTDPREIAQRVSHAAYAKEFQDEFSAPGENVFDRPEAVVGWVTVAIEVFEQTPAEFHPFSSKYDAFLRDKVDLSAQEKRGLALFNDIKKGNCATCHTSALKSPQLSPPIFTDFGYVALGAPRNQATPANANPKFYDLGLCGPLRQDFKTHPEYCGRFRTPSLRNVAMRQSYFHNGVFHSLKQVVEFYVTRDITPQKWYSRDAAGHVVKFDDMPPEYRKNVNNDAPFAPLPDGRPRLSEAEINDIVAFLKTLNDGYQPPAARARHQAAPKTLAQR